MATNLSSVNFILAAIYKAYSALASVVKPEGQPQAETAAQIVTKALPAFEELFAAIETLSGRPKDEARAASLAGLKWFFVEMTVFGAIVVPALDALALKLKATVPSFKKKGKGALAPELDQVQRLVWNASKTAYKQLQTSVEQQAAQIEASLSRYFTESELLGVSEQILPAEEDFAPIRALTREKAVEFASEKQATAGRVNQVAQLVSKQIKSVVDSRLK